MHNNKYTLHQNSTITKLKSTPQYYTHNAHTSVTITKILAEHLGSIQEPLSIRNLIHKIIQAATKSGSLPPPSSGRHLFHSPHLGLKELDIANGFLKHGGRVHPAPPRHELLQYSDPLTNPLPPLPRSYALWVFRYPHIPPRPCLNQLQVNAHGLERCQAEYHRLYRLLMI